MKRAVSAADPGDVTEGHTPMPSCAGKREAVSLGVKERLSPRQFCHPLQAPGKAFCWMRGIHTAQNLGIPRPQHHPKPICDSSDFTEWVIPWPLA